MRFLLLFSLFFVVGCTTSQLGASYTEVTEIKTKVREEAFMECKGKTEPITVEEYRSLPVLEKGCVAYLRENFVTSTPVLKDYEYYKVGIDETSSTLIMVKEPEEDPKIIKQ